MILITGSSGFIGSNLIHFLSNEKQRLQDSIVLLSSKKSTRFKTILHKNYTFTKLDFVENGVEFIDIVIHIGAFTPKNKIESNLVDENYANISNTIHLLKNLPNKPSKIIYCSTLDVYKNSNQIISEESVVQPETFYGKCKFFTEEYLQEYCENESIQLQILRLGHVYGSGEDRYEKIIPISIKKIKLGESLSLFTTGEEKRSYIHVLDCVRLIYRSMELKENNIINIVSKNSTSIKSILEILLQIAGRKEEQIQTGVQIGADSIFDCSKMEQLLGSEEIDIFSGLEAEFKDYQV